MIRFAVATGDIDGVNVDFETPTDYKPGSLVPFVNGQARITHATETGLKKFQLDAAPRAGDIVAALYRQI